MSVRDDRTGMLDMLAHAKEALNLLGDRDCESLERDRVAAWVKNDHLGFEILYIYRGVVRKYRPDFLIRLTSGDMLVLETKGQETEQDKVKQNYLAEWVQAVNSHGGFGQWRSAVVREPGEIRDVLLRYCSV